MTNVDRPILMRAASVLAVSLLAGVAACSSEARPVGDLVKDGDRFLAPETGQPYSGVAFSTFHGQPSVVAARLNLRDGAYHGPFEAYFQNRKLSSKENYRNGVKAGPYRWYFENGRLFEEGSYEDGALQGPYRAYWENGDLLEEGTYEDGEFDGPRRWYLEGRLIEVVTYRHGVVEGLYERYQDDGTLDLKGMLHAGEPCGVWFENEATITYPVCSSRVTE